MIIVMVKFNKILIEGLKYCRLMIMGTYDYHIINSIENDDDDDDCSFMIMKRMINHENHGKMKKERIRRRKRK